jgi:hypothetical protein
VQRKVLPPTFQRAESSAARVAVANQQQNGTQHSDEEAADVETVDSTETQCSGDESANESASNTEKYRNDKTSWVLSRHEQLGYSASNEAENDPTENAHIFLQSVELTTPCNAKPVLAVNAAC